MANISRRSVMGGASALPFIAAPVMAEISGVAPTSSDPAAWGRAVADYRQKLDCYRAAIYADAKLPFRDDMAWEEALDAACEAQRVLVGMRAPSYRAWAKRFALLVADDFHESTDADEIVAKIGADLARLSRLEGPNA